jgi:hypothetical protein
MGASFLMGCPLKVVARPLITCWTVVSVNYTHNLSLPANIGGYSTARKRSASEKTVVWAREVWLINNDDLVLLEERAL